MELRIKIKGIQCAGCFNRIDQSLQSLGIDRFDFDFASQVAVILFDEDRLNHEMIVETVENQGYTVTIVGEI